MAKILLVIAINTLTDRINHNLNIESKFHYCNINSGTGQQQSITINQYKQALYNVYGASLLGLIGLNNELTQKWFKGNLGPQMIISDTFYQFRK